MAWPSQWVIIRGVDLRISHTNQLYEQLLAFDFVCSRCKVQPFHVDLVLYAFIKNLPNTPYLR